MKKNKIYQILLLAVFVVFAISCAKDDNTGHSSLTPSNPTVNITVPTGEITIAEQDSVFEFAVELSEPQIVDVVVYINIIDGNATEGDDYTIVNGQSRVYIPAYSTKGSVKIKTLIDDVAEETESFTIQIGDQRTANATITPATVKFNLQNIASSDLNLGLEWDATVYDKTGKLIPPTTLADLRLLIVDEDGTILDEADGSSFESFLMVSEDWPDGEYYIAADFYTALDLGAQGTFSLDIALFYMQPGVQDNGILFPALMSSEVTCDAYRAILATVTKSGSTYTIEPVGTAEVAYDINNYTGEYSCNEPGYGDFVSNFTLGSDTTIVEDNFWDSGLEVVYILNPADQSIVVADGMEFDANAGRGVETWVITGEGTFNVCDYSMVVDYTVAAKADGAVWDENTHTYTKN